MWLHCDARRHEALSSFESFSLLLPLAGQHVNDVPHRSREQRVDSSLCDGCGVLSKTKAIWQAAWPRPDQTGPSPLDPFFMALISGRV